MPSLRVFTKRDVWNVGEPPIEGFTTYLWVLIGAAGFRAGLDPLRLMQGIGIVTALGTIVLTSSSLAAA
jgi:arabinofuranosyltransferase